MVDMVDGLWFTKCMTNSEINWKNAKAAYEMAKTAKARREAAEDIEFWSSKMAAEYIAERNGWAS